MKRYIVFGVSFIVLFMLLQILSGYFMTLLYNPDKSRAWNQTGNLSNSVVIGGSSYIVSLMTAGIAAIIAYFISKKLCKQT